MRRLPLLSLVSALALAAGSARAEPVRVIVGFEGTPNEATVAAHGGEVDGRNDTLRTLAARLPAAAVSHLRLADGVAYVEADAVVTADVSDTLRANQYGLDQVHADSAWSVTAGSGAVKIAILDTGVDTLHSDLSGKVVLNKNFTTSRTTADKQGHGTHTAGIAGASTDNAKGVAALGFASSLMNVKVLGDTGSGYTSWVANGITFAADNGANVISMSLGSGSASTTLENAVNYAWGKGAVLVAAAGNNGSSAKQYPGAYDNCIAVAATDAGRALASYSNYGPWVDVAAPGSSILSTYLRTRKGADQYAYLSGTSMATPFVSGLAGLVWTANGWNGSNWEVRGRIESTLQPGPTAPDGGVIGIIDASAAVQPPPTPEPTPAL